MPEGKLDWHGMNDGTPSSSPETNPKDMPDVPASKGSEWKGLPDSTPPSKPTAPDKE